MKRQFFKDYLREGIMVLDGAFGTELVKRGMPKGVCPEHWVIENPESIIDIQREYVKAGSDAVFSCTLGATRLKLDEYGLGDKVVEMNRKLVQLSREAVGPDKFVAGDISTTGHFVKPFGDMPFEQAVDIYKEQVKGLLEGGVDFFVIETMIDIQETRAALLAVKESCDLPVCVCMTFDEEGRTLTGTDPVTAVITLQSLGADAVGCNCSTGPQTMLKVIEKMKPHARVPIIAKPNAGLPKLIEGKTVFSMGPEEFGGYIKAFVDAGVNMIDGCCGTSPEYIRRIAGNITGMKPVHYDVKPESAITSSRKTVHISFDNPVAIIGERINPTGKKKLQEELREGKTFEVRRFAAEQVESGAVVLDVNTGMPGIDEKETMVKLVELLSSLVETPLCIDSSSPEVIEAALRIYPGRALINSISAEKVKMDRLLPVAAKYGAMFILLPLDDRGVPDTAEKRCTIVEQVYNTAAGYGYEKQDILVDGLVMTVSSDQRAAMETLKVIDWCTNTFGCGTVAGLSNVSFGLPERSWINAAFLAMAVGRGLTAAIANPSVEMLMNLKMASDVLTFKDKNSMEYISCFSQTGAVQKAESPETGTQPAVDRIYNAVVRGDRDNVTVLIDMALKEGIKPGEIVDRYLIPAITNVGQLYDKREYFLPQLIQSAETMKKAFGHLEPLLSKDEDAVTGKKTKIVLATVKGDIHDIGKNIVGLMLRNYGFEVHDLGKDVDAGFIVSRAKEIGAHIIGLSALMTTTMTEMQTVINLARKEGLDCRFMIGGAVVNEQYAREIGADGYSEDAYAAVKLARRLSVTGGEL